MTLYISVLNYIFNDKQEVKTFTTLQSLWEYHNLLAYCKNYTNHSIKTEESWEGPKWLEIYYNGELKEKVNYFKINVDAEA